MAGQRCAGGGYDTPQQSVLDWKRQLARVLVANKDHRTEGKDGGGKRSWLRRIGLKDGSEGSRNQ